jgi:Fic family protein
MQGSPAATRLGRYVEAVTGDEVVRAFVPPPLPPIPPIEIAPLLERLGEADRALGRLDGVSRLLPNKELFLYMYVRKEAVLSSQIEGTVSTLDDLLQFESEPKATTPFKDVQEVSNYVAAMMHGLKRMAELPISLRLIREMHAILLRSGRGVDKNPGEFRRTQNWLGGTRPGNAMFVPPPPNEMMACLDNFEKFLHDETTKLPPLIRAGLLHVQFETIHPFSDGNGRAGRLLITLDLCARGILHQPLLYLSHHFKSRQQDYYRLIQEVRDRGAWEAWLEFFLDGVTTTANEAFENANTIAELLDNDRAKIASVARAAPSTIQVYNLLPKTPFITTSSAAQRTGLTPPTINSAISQLQSLGILKEITGKQRDRVYAYENYLDILRDNPNRKPAPDAANAGYGP